MQSYYDMLARGSSDSSETQHACQHILVTRILLPMSSRTLSGQRDWACSMRARMELPVTSGIRKCEHCMLQSAAFEQIM